MSYRFRAEIKENNVIELFEPEISDTVPFIRQDINPETGQPWASKEEAEAWIAPWLTVEKVVEVLVQEEAPVLE